MVDSLTVGLTDLTGGPSGLAGIPSFSVGGYSFATPRQMYYLVAGVIVVLVLVLHGRHALGLRPRAQIGAHRPDRGGGARRQRARATSSRRW